MRACYNRLPVANIKSQIKRNRQNEKRRLRNRAARSEMRTRAKNAFQAIEAERQGRGGEPGDTEAAVVVAVKRIDKAAAQGVIHPNQAARRKSRLMKRAPAQSQA